MNLRRCCLLVVLAILLSACGKRDPLGADAAVPTPSPRPHNPGVVELIRQQPPIGQTVEVDGYSSAPQSFPLSESACPWVYSITDRPFPQTLHLLDLSWGNHLPDNAPFLTAMTVPVFEALQKGGKIPLPTQIAYHARLRGHFVEQVDYSRFPACRRIAERIFVVEDVVTVYEGQAPSPPGNRLTLPDDYAAWPRYKDAKLNYNLPYPPGWTVEPSTNSEALAELSTRIPPPPPPDTPVPLSPNPTPGPQIELKAQSAVVIRAPQLPEYPVVARIYTDEPFSSSTAGRRFEQGHAFGEGTIDTQRLSGVMDYNTDVVGDQFASVRFEGNGRMYELTIRYPTGFDAQQWLLTAYSAMVEGFQIEGLPNPMPTPTADWTLMATPTLAPPPDAGPFLSEYEAIARVSERTGQVVEFIVYDLWPQSTAEARARTETCRTLPGQHAGVWVLVVRSLFDGSTQTKRLYLDALTGEQLCAEEAGNNLEPSGHQPSPFPAGSRLTLAASQPSGSRPLHVQFRAHLIKDTNAQQSFACYSEEWDFGDGQKQSQIAHCSGEVNELTFIQEHTYERAGVYHVRIYLPFDNYTLAANVVAIEVR